MGRCKPYVGSLVQDRKEIRDRINCSMDAMIGTISAKNQDLLVDSDTLVRCTIVVNRKKAGNYFSWLITSVSFNKTKSLCRENLATATRHSLQPSYYSPKGKHDIGHIDLMTFSSHYGGKFSLKIAAVQTGANAEARVDQSILLSVGFLPSLPHYVESPQAV